MSHGSPRVVAGVEVIPLCDAIGAMGESLRRPVEETFSGASPDDWAGLSRDEWILHFHCYLLRSGGRTVLVDTGIGGVGSPASSWAPVPGALPDELSRVGVAAADVDVVVLTHLHSDHVGGALGLAFPNARHVLQRVETETASAQVREVVLGPLADHLEIVDGTAEVAPGVRVHLTPGHTPGHQVVEVGDLMLTGDVILHPIQLVNPKVTYIYDDDPARAADSRVKLLDRVRAAGGSIATGHFTDPFTRV